MENGESQPTPVVPTESPEIPGKISFQSFVLFGWRNTLLIFWSSGKCT